VHSCGRHFDCPIGVVKLLVRRDVTDRILIADVLRDPFANRHDLARFLRQERFTPRCARDLPENSRVAVLVVFVE